MYADRFIVTDHQDNLVAEFKEISKLRAFLQQAIAEGKNIATEYKIETIKHYTGLMVWNFVVEPSQEY